MLAALLLLLTLLPARAQGAADPADEFTGELSAYSDKLEALPAAGPDCRAPYAKAYAGGSPAIGVFFGFIDTGRENYVADGDFKRALVRRLTAPCRGRLAACGFAAAPADPAEPNKTRLLKRRGDGPAAIDVYDSSVSGDYAASVGRLASEQEERSSLAEKEYLTALEKYPVVLYAGHTRRFGGTGFYAPLGLTKATSTTLLRRPFFSRMCETLKSSSARPAVLGMFACHTREYYAGKLHALVPGTALIVSSDSSTHEENLLGLLGAVETILARPCAHEAERSLDAAGPGVFHIYGLFEGAPHVRYTRYLDGRLVALGFLLIPFLVLFVSGRAVDAVSARPAPRAGARRGALLMTLLLIPCTLALRAFTEQSTALPLLLALWGTASLAVAVLTGRLSREEWTGSARLACPAFLAGLVLYSGANLVQEASLDNALSAARQAGMFALVAAAVWPFVLVSEEVLSPFGGDGWAEFLSSCLHTLAFYLAVWLALCVLAPVYKPKLWPVAALAIYVRTAGVLLGPRKRRLLVPAVALALALLVTEGVHALIYN